MQLGRPYSKVSQRRCSGITWNTKTSDVAFRTRIVLLIRKRSGTFASMQTTTFAFFECLFCIIDPSIYQNIFSPLLADAPVYNKLMDITAVAKRLVQCIKEN
mmetsp:Transcript_36338/g.57832  ORF Transcript_36338/g.57832 Transcript_36338/m.57832 type:complete len:102 (+) Transcript_36338:232-537(+)